MGFDALKSGLDSLANRFLLVSLLPTTSAALLILILLLAGAPGRPPDWAAAWKSLTGAGAGAIVGVVLVCVLLALLLRPLQLALVRGAEGYWPRWCAPLTSLMIRRHAQRRASLQAIATNVPDDPHHDLAVQIAGRAGTELRERYPAGDPLLPTTLGNVLAAGEQLAGAAYGFDAVSAWPRLYPLLPATTRTLVDDRRNTLDAAVVTAATMTAAGLAALPLLARSGWWLLLALVPLALAAAAYRGAIEAALGYGQAVDAAFELHRFDLYRALRLPLPSSHADEVTLVRGLCRQWRQGGLDPARHYEHPKEG